MYTVRICKSYSNDTRIGPFHASIDACVTLCGREIDSRWWIENHFGGDLVTCKRCLCKLAVRCDVLADAIETHEWADGDRSRMYEVAALLNCYAHNLRAEADDLKRPDPLCEALNSGDGVYRP